MIDDKRIDALVERFDLDAEDNFGLPGVLTRGEEWELLCEVRLLRIEAKAWQSLTEGRTLGELVAIAQEYDRRRDEEVTR